MKFTVTREIKHVKPYPRATYTDKKLKSVTVKAEDSYNSRRVLEKLADALERDFSTININSNGSVQLRKNL